MLLFISCIKALVTFGEFHMASYHKLLCAYLDPGTGSIIFQVIIAGLCGGLLVIKLFWGKIKSLFKKLFSWNNKEEEK